MPRLGVALIAILYFLLGLLLLTTSLGLIVVKEEPSLITRRGLTKYLPETIPVSTYMLFTGILFLGIAIGLWNQNSLALWLAVLLEAVNIITAETLFSRILSILIIIYLLAVREDFD